MTTWLNVSWQEAPELKHDVIKIGAALDVFWPSWAKGLTLDNHISTEEIKKRKQWRIKKKVLTHA